MTKIVHGRKLSYLYFNGLTRGVNELSQVEYDQIRILAQLNNWNSKLDYLFLILINNSLFMSKNPRFFFYILLLLIYYILIISYIFENYVDPLIHIL